jgi:hypothetical protein
MKLSLAGVVLLLSVACGCVQTAPVPTIPGWVGIPCNMLTPNSLEAETYRNQYAAALLPPAATLSAPLPSGY